jgi:hypothetical protein
VDLLLLMVQGETILLAETLPRLMEHQGFAPCLSLPLGTLKPNFQLAVIEPSTMVEMLWQKLDIRTPDASIAVLDSSPRFGCRRIEAQDFHRNCSAVDMASTTDSNLSTRSHRRCHIPPLASTAGSKFVSRDSS